MISTNTCGPLTAVWGCNYCITFIDYFSGYGDVELINEKFYSLGVFKPFKAKVELQLVKLIKAMKFNKVVIIMEDTMRLDEIMGNLLSFLWNVVVMLDI